MTAKKTLEPQDLDTFRKAIGLASIVTAADGAYEFDDDVDNVPNEVGLATVATELSLVERDLMIADAKYRAWRAIAAANILAGDPKLAEWKVRAKIEADPAFLQHKELVAKLTEVRVALEGFRVALSVA